MNQPRKNTKRIYTNARPASVSLTEEDLDYLKSKIDGRVRKTLSHVVQLMIDEDRRKGEASSPAMGEIPHGKTSTEADRKVILPPQAAQHARAKKKR